MCEVESVDTISRLSAAGAGGSIFVWCGCTRYGGGHERYFVTYARMSDWPEVPANSNPTLIGHRAAWRRYGADGGWQSA